MDEIDQALLSELQKDGRISMAELGKMLNIAPSTAFKRIEKMKQKGIIERFTIAINPKFFEQDLITFLTINVDPEEKDEIAQFLEHQHRILEVYETLEPCDFIAKARVSTITQLKMDILIPLSEHPGVKEIKPFITVKRIKEQY
jgi:Lrp/AsnC family leucine-responsive transcriptional regulator